MMSKFIIGAAVAIVSSILGFIAGRIGAWIERRHQRHALASALLCELSVINSIARQIYNQGHPASLDYLSHPVLEGALSKVNLFSPHTASELTQLNSTINSFILQIDHIFKYRPEGRTGEMAEFNVKGMAYFLANQIVTVVPLLIAAGGMTPKLPEERNLSSDSMPELPKNPFTPYGSLDQ